MRDVTMGEDGNRTRVGSGPQVLAALRNAAISQLRMTGSTKIAAALRRNAARISDLLKSLSILQQLNHPGTNPSARGGCTCRFLAILVVSLAVA